MRSGYWEIIKMKYQTLLKIVIPFYASSGINLNFLEYKVEILFNISH